jgi:hypothetical protein
MNRNRLHKDREGDNVARTDYFDSSAQPAAAASSSSAPQPPIQQPAAASSSSSSSNPITQKARQLLRKPVPERNRSSVRIRRTPSAQSITQVTPPTDDRLDDIQEESSRRRSSSEPQRPQWLNPSDPPLGRSTTVTPMPPLSEEPARTEIRAPVLIAPHLAPHLAPLVGPHGTEAGAIHATLHAGPHTEPYLVVPEQQQPGRLRRATDAARSAIGMGPRNSENSGSDNGSTVVEIGHPGDEYDSDMVDLLDVIGMVVERLANGQDADQILQILRSPPSPPSQTFKTLFSSPI